MTKLLRLPITLPGAPVNEILLQDAARIAGLNPVVWTSMRNADFLGVTVGNDVQTLDVELPAGAAQWNAVNAGRRPARALKNGLFYQTPPADGMSLAGAPVPNTGYTKLSIFKLDAGIATTAHMLTSAETSATRHSLNYSPNGGGTIVANNGLGLDKQTTTAAIKGAWTWAISAYSRALKTTFLETESGMAVPATWVSDDIAAEPGLNMGCATATGSGYFAGEMGESIVLGDCCFALDGEDDIPLARTRRFLKDYAVRMIAIRNA